MWIDAILGNAPAILVFLTLGAFSWIYGGMRGPDLLPAVPWLYAFLFEAAFFFPQRRPYEDSVAARTRVWKALGKDPAFHLGIVFVALLAVPLANVGLCETCDYALLRAGASAAPRMPWAPFCVNAREHSGVLVWFVPALTAMLAARHSLLRSGKRLLFEMIVWNAAALAAFGFVQQMTGAEFPFWGENPGKVHFFSTFGYPNMGGAFFTMAFAFSVGLWRQRCEEAHAKPAAEGAKSSSEHEVRRIAKAHYPLVAAALNFFGAMATLCRASMLLCISLAVLAFLYAEARHFLAKRGRSLAVRRGAYVAAGALVFAVAACVFAPEGFAKEWKTISSKGVLQRGKDDYHGRLALEIFADHPFFGVGGWGYSHFGRTYFDRMTMDRLLPCQAVAALERDAEGRVASLEARLPDGTPVQAKLVAVETERSAAGAEGYIASGAGAGRGVAELLKEVTRQGAHFQPNPGNGNKYRTPQRGLVRMRSADGGVFDREAEFLFLKCADVALEETLDAERRLSGLKAVKADGTKLDVAAVVVEREKPAFQKVGGANVHNDYLQFLCEHGGVGFGLLALIVGFAAAPAFAGWFRLYRAARFSKGGGAPAAPAVVFCVPPGTLWILLGNASVMVHALGDCPFRSAAVLSAFLAALGCADGFFTRENGGDE